MLQVKNRAAADVQVTAEQMIRAARDHQIGDEEKLEKLRVDTRITDSDELKLHQAEKRREFENKLRQSMVNVGAYLRYARWEESQMEYRRVRSIFERALVNDNRDHGLWIKYAEFEMRNKFINHARNVFDRAVQHLPRIAQLWFKYTQFEETLGQLEKARLVFERWMQWHPEEQAWLSFVKFETRHGQLENARDVLERMCGALPKARSYIKYARWEESNQQLALARHVFERALEELDKSEATKEALFLAFASFEERCKEFDRARAIYKQSLDLLPKADSREIYDAFVSFERQHGDRNSIEGVLAAKRRTQYEEQLKAQPANYDTWMDYVKLEEAYAHAEAMAVRLKVEAIASSSGDGAVYLEKDRAYAASVVTAARERVRKVYRRAVAVQPPPKTEKVMWKRYIYLWINFALFEELETQDMESCRAVLRDCLNVIPHQKFTFGKIWIMAAHFELRRNKLEDARKLLGEAIGRCPKDKIFRAYIQLELQLGNADRCRLLYNKYLEFAPHNCFIWEKYAALEQTLFETARARAIFELAVNQPVLDMPESLWKAYIDFEIGLNSQKGRENAHKLYERLLEFTQHVKVWISFAKFQAVVCSNLEESRKTFRKAYEKLKAKQVNDQDLETKEERALLLSSWLQMERKLETSNVETVEKLQPRRVKRKRELPGGTWEEYWDYMFPDDPKKGLRLLEAARKWQQRQERSSDNTAAAPAAASAAPSASDGNEIDLDDI